MHRGGGQAARDEHRGRGGNRDGMAHPPAQRCEHCARVFVSAAAPRPRSRGDEASPRRDRDAGRLARAMAGVDAAGERAAGTPLIRPSGTFIDIGGKRRKG